MWKENHKSENQRTRIMWHHQRSLPKTTSSFNDFQRPAKEESDQGSSTIEKGEEGSQELSVGEKEKRNFPFGIRYLHSSVESAI